MASELQRLIEKARRYQMTPEERQEQRISLAWGNLAIEDPSVTREEVIAACGTTSLDSLSKTTPSYD